MDVPELSAASQPTGGEQAANALQRDGSSRYATTANAEVGGRNPALSLVTRRPYLSSHGRSHRFDPCHAHQPKRLPVPTLRAVCQKICQKTGACAWSHPVSVARSEPSASRESMDPWFAEEVRTWCPARTPRRSGATRRDWSLQRRGGRASIVCRAPGPPERPSPGDRAGCATLISDTGSGRLRDVLAGERWLSQKRTFEDRSSTQT